MKPSHIKAGHTYHNRGKGKTKRTVIAIGREHAPKKWLGGGPRPDEPGVLYEQEGIRAYLYLSSFAAWCGGEVS